MKVDTGTHELEMFFKPWQVAALHAVMDNAERATSATVWRRVLEETRISRANIISFLEQLAREGILERWEETGKGGHRGVYRLSLSEPQLREHLTLKVLRKLLQEFPEETRNTVKTLQTT